MNINNWLDNSLKNEYYHSHDPILEDKEYYKSWRDAITELGNKMNNKWTKEEYLTWVRTWKAVYSKLTQESQSSKRYRAMTHVMDVNAIARDQAFMIAGANLTHFHYLRGWAGTLLALRHEAKILAEEAYLASHPEKVLDYA